MRKNGRIYVYEVKYISTLGGNAIRKVGGRSYKRAKKLFLEDYGRYCKEIISIKKIGG